MFALAIPRSPDGIDRTRHTKRSLRRPQPQPCPDLERELDPDYHHRIKHRRRFQRQLAAGFGTAGR